MFVRMLVCALLRQKRKLVMIAVTMALGVSLSTAMLNVMMDVEEKVNQELKVYGANLNVVPRGASLLGDLYGIADGAGIADKYILEEELPKMKTVFFELAVAKMNFVCVKRQNRVSARAMIMFMLTAAIMIAATAMLFSGRFYNKVSVGNFAHAGIFPRFGFR